MKQMVLKCVSEGDSALLSSPGGAGMSPGVLAWGGWGQLGQQEPLGYSPFPAPLSAWLLEGAVWQSPGLGGLCLMPQRIKF